VCGIAAVKGENCLWDCCGTVSKLVVGLML